MALTPEWNHRIKRWEDALWESIYVPLKTVELVGHTTTLRLIRPGSQGELQGDANGHSLGRQMGIRLVSV